MAAPKKKSKTKSVYDHSTPVVSVSRGTKYWRGRVFIGKFGVVHGEATPEQIDEFVRLSPHASLDKWLLDHDPYAELIAQRSKKRKML